MLVAAISLTPGSPDWWLSKLQTSLQVKKARLDRLARYGRGDAPLIDIAENVRDAYVDFQKRSRSNFAGLSVDVMLDRTRVSAIRTGAEGDLYGDSVAWQMWQANQLDADSNALHRSCFTLGEAFAIVGPVDASINAPVVTIEDPRQMAIAHDPMRRRAIRAALKTFTDEWTGNDHSYLYLRGANGARARVLRAERSAEGAWAWVQDQELPFSQIPVVWFPNMLDIDGKTTYAEFEQHTDVLDRIHTTVLQRIVIGAMQAYRQRAIKGLPLKDANGAAINYEGLFAADPAALWQLPQSAEIWESATVDLNPLLLAARDDIKDFAAVTRTPLPALSPDAQNQSAQGTELVKSGLVAKVVDRMTSLSESWEQVMQLMFLWSGDQVRATRTDMEVLWSPPDLPGMVERFDAAQKAKAAGISDDYIRLNIIGMSPQEIARMASATV